jgi:hypothetical protein
MTLDAIHEVMEDDSEWLVDFGEGPYDPQGPFGPSEIRGRWLGPMTETELLAREAPDWKET